MNIVSTEGNPKLIIVLSNITLLFFFFSCIRVLHSYAQYMYEKEASLAFKTKEEILFLKFK